MSLLGDTESDINRLRCATLQRMACTSKRPHSNYDVIRSPAYDRPALAEVCTVPLLLVLDAVDKCTKKLTSNFFKIPYIKNYKSRFIFDGVVQDIYIYTQGGVLDHSVVSSSDI